MRELRLDNDVSGRVTFEAAVRLSENAWTYMTKRL